ncbi:MAG: cyclic nucleotide-binding domain-containing protein [Xanthomonadales bacterium]|nr:cyclic nucleotide-binding domain-containing protein [Xanthomonadales bacterium]
MGEPLEIAIIGSGPAGLSAAARAAESGVSHLLLEASPHLAHTIYRYQKGKHVMDEPAQLPLRAALPFRAGSREQVLTAWEEGVRRLGVRFRTGAEVTALRREGDGFTLTVNGRERLAARRVVLAIGLQGNIRKLGVPGQDLPCVQYQLDDPDEFQGETIAVVGAGDAAIENALALAGRNQVILVNRREEFSRAKEGNLRAVLKAIEEGRIECFYRSSPERVEQLPAGRRRARLVLATPDGEAQILCDRIIARLGASPPRAFVEACGVVFPSADPNAVPVISPQYESNVPGLYIVGALAGYPLIKQAMNQGYEVVETILGRQVEPADAPLLRQKLAKLPRFRDLDAAIAWIRQQAPVLSGLSPLQVREVLLEAEVHAPAPGAVVFRRNDYSNSFYAVLDGAVEAETAEGQRFRLRAREFFGEMSLISGRRRNATVTALEGCVLLEIPRRTMLRLMQSVQAIREAIDRAFAVRAIQTRLAPEATPEQVQELARQATLHRYRAGDVLFSEGEVGDCLHLVRSGSLTVSRNIAGREVVLSYVSAGNYVGEMALLGETRRTATVRAAIATETLRIDGKAFKRVVERNPVLRLRLQEAMRARTAANLAMQADPRGGDLISFLIAQGAGEATDILLIDESLCIRCDNCEKACAETHGGTSRLDREAGPTFAEVHVPTSCRHCEHPHCMKDCPPDAIHRAPNGEVYIADNCIGCGNCERNCPYGVIHMAERPARKPGLLAWLLFGLGPGPGESPKRAGAGGEKSAVKCDMCRDLAGGPACVRSCPTGAAIRIAPEEFPAYARARR